MEHKLKTKHTATTSSGQPENSPADSPLSSIVSSLSSLSHAFEEDDEDLHSVHIENSPHGSPPLEPIPDLSRARVTSSPPPAPVPQAPPVQPVPVVNRYIREETVPIRKTDKAPQDGFVGRLPEVVGGGGHVGGGGQRRRVRSTGKEGWMRKFALGFRAMEVLFCVVSLSVMATDKSKGWALDSFYRYKEFRYCMGVNVIGFAYAVLQACDLVYQLATGSHGTRRHYLRYYFDFAMDQMLTYLLISSGSSAATRVDDWKSNWGADKFPELATTSVGLGFVAFVAFAFSSLVSGYSLYTSTSS